MKFDNKRPAGAINQIRTSKHFCISKFASGLLGNDVIWIATLPILIEGVDTFPCYITILFSCPSVDRNLHQPRRQSVVPIHVGQ
jgi:hypothetical protein